MPELGGIRAVGLGGRLHVEHDLDRGDWLLLGSEHIERILGGVDEQRLVRGNVVVHDGARDNHHDWQHRGVDDHHRELFVRDDGPS